MYLVKCSAQEIYSHDIFTIAIHKPESRCDGFDDCSDKSDEVGCSEDNGDSHDIYDEDDYQSDDQMNDYDNFANNEDYG